MNDYVLGTELGHRIRGGSKRLELKVVSRFSIFRFEIYSTDESGSRNFELKFWAAHNLSRGLVSIFGGSEVRLSLGSGGRELISL